MVSLIKEKLEEILGQEKIKRSEIRKLLDFVKELEKKDNDSSDSDEDSDVEEESSDISVIHVQQQKMIPQPQFVPDDYGCEIAIPKKIYVDGGQGSYSGEEAWGRVTNEKGEDLLPHFGDLYKGLAYKDVHLPVGKSRVMISKFGDVKTKQVNGAELIALMIGLKIAIYLNKERRWGIKEICSDSQVVLSWANGRLQSSTKKKMDARKIGYITETMLLKKEFEKQGGSLVKISGDANFADLGWHV